MGYHGAGPNSIDRDRVKLIVQYSLSWLRQEENQYLGCSAEVLDTLPEQLLCMMGYERGVYSLGFIDGSDDPIAAVRPDLARGRSNPISLEDTKKSIR